MKSKALLPLGIGIVVLGILAFNALFTVHQTQQALVLQFGDFVRTEQTPGLKVKMPFIQNVLYLENRVLRLDPPVQSVLLADQNRLLVDSYARYKIDDPLLFYQSVRTEAVANDRLGNIINAQMRGVLGNATLTQVLSENRSSIMTQIRDRVNQEAKRFGMAVVDVRIGRADYPEENSQKVFDRMKSERVQEAKEFRAQGFEQAQRIESTADRQATILRAEARREAEILRGEGDAERSRILARAFGQDKNFFDFYRSLQAYRTAIQENNSMLVIPPDSEFFRFFNSTGKAQ